MSQSKTMPLGTDRCKTFVVPTRESKEAHTVAGLAVNCALLLSDNQRVERVERVERVC